MNDPLRIGPRWAERPDGSAQISAYYRHAQRTIRCESRLCHCPARGVGSHSFVFVDERRRFIYFAVPKCGSTTILHDLFAGRHTLPSRDPERDLGDYFKFTFVRNPWDRMVSNWEMFTNDPAARAQLRSMTDRDLQELSTFEAFVDFADRVKNHHWQPQAIFLPEQLDFVGRLESFDTDFAHACASIGKPLSVAPRRRARATTSPYWTHYTPELAATVARMYPTDIDAFGYEFAGPGGKHSLTIRSG